MRKFALSVFALFFGLLAMAQEITGAVKDEDGKALPGVTVSLMKDSTLVKLAATKDDGKYVFAGIAEGKYYVAASYVGYETSRSAAVVVNQQPATIPELKLKKAAGGMQNVTVTARKPIVEMKADKTILNVEGTINATGSDALELLRKSPGVMVDKDDNLTVSGKNGVQVYVDGRPTPLSGQDLAAYLKSLQSAQIEAIEIITNPSAKYEAAGNAGIINIRLKKNKSFGTNGSINAGYNVGLRSRYNGGFSLNHRNKNINIYGNYNYNGGSSRNKISIFRNVLDTFFQQTNNMIIDNSGHNFKAGLDYMIDKKSSLGAIVTGNLSDNGFATVGRTNIIYIPTNTKDRELRADNKSSMSRNAFNYNLNYSYNGSKGKNLVLNADYGSFDINSNQYQPNEYYSPSGTLLSSVIYRMIAPTAIGITSFKADYEQDFAKGKLGVGGKVAYINSDNDFQRYNVYTSGDVLDKDRSNRFKYNEAINAGYVNFNRSIKGAMIQAGLRVENTLTEGRSSGLKNNGNGYEPSLSGFDRAYTDFFPSAAVTFNKNPMKQWGLSYSRRIDRPFYQDLNPFEFKIDEYTFQKGNINLRPQYTNSFKLSHTYKYKLNASVSYSHVKDIFTQLVDTTEKSKSFLSRQNLATQDIVSFNASYPFMYKNFSAFMNLNANYSMYEADFGTGRKIDLSAMGLNYFMQNSLKFGKTKTWTAELSGFYNAPTIYMGAFKGKALWSVDAGMQKTIMKGNATVKASVSDLFNSLTFRGSSDFAGQHSDFKFKGETQQFKLAFNLRFGNNQVKAAKQRNSGADEENKRTQTNNGIGISQ